jgi:N-acyl homoserine lactone hydrolase
MRDPRPREDEAGNESKGSPTTITPVLVGDLLAEGERMPVYVHVIDHPDARVLVDTGMTQLHPAVADMDPRLNPLSAQADFDLASVDIVINTHLHFDHCGGNHLFTGRPIYVQRQELDEPRTEGQRLIRELDPDEVWLSHEHEPWRPQIDEHN